MTAEDDGAEPGDGEVPESSATAESDEVPGADDLPEPPEADASPEKKKCWFVRACRFIWAHRAYYLLVVLAMAAAYTLGYIFARKWGAQQWGPASEWVAGLLTLGAVVIALREAMRAQREREIDLELERRRECIRAVADYWSAIAKLRSLCFDLVFFLISRDFSQPEQQAKALEERRAFHRAFQDVYQPQRFYSSLILHETPLVEAFQALDEKVDEVRRVLVKLLEGARNGVDPKVAPAYAIWNEIGEVQPRHFELARSTFSLDRRTVRSQLHGRRT